MANGNDGISWSDISGIPSVLTNLGQEAVKLLKDPRAYILGILFEVFIGGLLQFLGRVLGLVQQAFVLAADAVALFGPLIGGAFQPGAAALFGMLGAVGDLLLGVASLAGPLAPVVVAVVLAALGYLLYEAAPVVIGVISPRLARVLEVLPGR